MENSFDNIWIHVATTEAGSKYKFSAFYRHTNEEAENAIYNLYDKKEKVISVDYKEFGEDLLESLNEGE